MRKQFFDDRGITSTSANHIANMAKEYIQTLENKIVLKDKQLTYKINYKLSDKAQAGDIEVNQEIKIYQACTLVYD